MELLPLEYRISDRYFKQIKRGEKSVIYRAYDDGCYIFEIFLIKVSKAGSAVIGGVERIFKEKERIPRNEDFGVWAWTTTSCNENSLKAEQIFQRLECKTENLVENECEIDILKIDSYIN